MFLSIFSFLFRITVHKGANDFCIFAVIFQMRVHVFSCYFCFASIFTLELDFLTNVIMVLHEFENNTFGAMWTFYWSILAIFFMLFDFFALNFLVTIFVLTFDFLVLTVSCYMSV